MRGKFVEELWGLAREFRIREQERAKADQLGKKLARLEGVEAELREAERCVHAMCISMNLRGGGCW